MAWHTANVLSPEGRTGLLKIAKQISRGEGFDNAVIKPTF